HECQGATCTYTCETGFIFQNSQKSAVIVCSNGAWIGMSNLVCEPISCSMPKIEYADVDCPNGTNYRNRCTFRCRSNAMMIGQMNYMTCEENGLWTVPEAFCQVVCTHEGLLARNVSQDSMNCKANRVYDTQPHHPVSTVCRLNCRRHYRASQSHSLQTK
ncbi:unnamed protein product, partial [Gongylonema pulchrum]|uniref:Selectin E n=1 Tax=Gongylonema pulchrum TaxID=637853 RepID=A0A183CZE1_9BILA